MENLGENSDKIEISSMNVVPIGVKRSFDSLPLSILLFTFHLNYPFESISLDTVLAT